MDSWSRTGERDRPAGESGLQGVDFVQSEGPAGVQPSQAVGAFSKNLVASLVTASTLRSVPAGYTEDLLSVAQVAARLRVSNATVYGLVERGALAHVRVSNAIRVAPADLAAFVEASRKSNAPPG